MFLGLRKLGNICCGHEMFLSETFVSATMCPQQCVLVCQGLKTHPGKYPIDTLFAFCQYNNKEYLSKLLHVKTTQAKDLSVNNLSLEAKHSSFSPTTIGFYRIPGGRGGWYSHIWAI